MRKKIVTLIMLFIIVLSVTLAASATIDTAYAAGRVQVTETDLKMTVITTPVPFK